MSEDANATLQPFFEDMRQWQKTSDTYRNEFAKTGDPLIVVRFLNENPFAFRADWVLREVERWRQQQKYDLLNQVFSRRKGHSKDEQTDQTLDFFLVLEVDKLVSEGATKAQAFEKLTAFKGRNRTIEGVKKAYERSRKHMFQKFISENRDSYVIEVRNANVAYFDANGKPHFLFGTWTYTLPK